MYSWLWQKKFIIYQDFFSKLLSFLNGLSCICQIGLKLKIIRCSFWQLPTSVCQSVGPFIYLSFHPSVHRFDIPRLTFPNGDSPLVHGERISHRYPCPKPKIAFASLLLITLIRLGVTLICLILIFMHEQGFGIKTPFVTWKSTLTEASSNNQFLTHFLNYVENCFSFSPLKLHRIIFHQRAIWHL